jgi:hypothetical protein
VTNDELIGAARKAGAVRHLKRVLETLISDAPTDGYEVVSLVQDFPDVITPDAVRVFHQSAVDETQRQLARAEAELKPFYDIVLPRTWHSGPPPHIGWWNANNGRAENAWRWWDGARWSEGVMSTDNAWFAASCAETPIGNPHDIIEWSDYWPENARVPRVAP